MIKCVNWRFYRRQERKVEGNLIFEYSWRRDIILMQGLSDLARSENSGSPYVRLNCEIPRPANMYINRTSKGWAMGLYSDNC